MEERKIIDHGSIRCIWSATADQEIQAGEPCDEVGTGIIGDDDLAAELIEIVENDSEGEIDFDSLRKLEDFFRGLDLDDYIDSEKEDELKKLDKLIDAAREI